MPITYKKVGKTDKKRSFLLNLLFYSLKMRIVPCLYSDLIIYDTNGIPATFLHIIIPVYAFYVLFAKKDDVFLII